MQFDLFCILVFYGGLQLLSHFGRHLQVHQVVQRICLLLRKNLCGHHEVTYSVQAEISAQSGSELGFWLVVRPVLLLLHCALGLLGDS
jgi:hypothetical protein